MPLLLLIMNIGIVGAAVLQCIAPLYFRPGIFFGVAVDPDFPGSETARRILWRYRRPIIVGSVLCSAALWLVVPRLSGIAAPLAASGTVFVEVSVAIVSMAATSRHVRAFAKPQTSTRTASLVPRKETLPGGWLPFAGPMLIVGAVRFLLFMRRDSMPAETYRGALTVLIVAFVTNALFMWFAWLVVFRMRQINPGGLAAIGENADRRVAYWIKLLLAYLFTVFNVALIFSVAGITTAFRGPRLVVLIMAMWVAMAIFIVAYVLKRRRGALETADAPLGDSTPDACWKWGIIYYNPNDPAFVVETRSGPFGCDLNFGNKWSWVASGVIVATPFLIRVLWL
jgi:uncharacterized membrane protein